MGNSINLSETLIISLGSMAIVLAILILFAISLLIKLSKMTAEVQLKNNVENNSVQTTGSNNIESQAAGQVVYDSGDEEDRLVAVLAASAMTAQSRPDSHFRVSKVTRIK